MAEHEDESPRQSGEEPGARNVELRGGGPSSPGRDGGDGGDGSNGARSPDADVGDARLAEVRELLVGPELRRMRELEQQVADLRPDASQVGDVLPDAVRMRSSRDKKLGQALAPTVEAALQASVKRNPKVLADAIFPIIGPAIRKSIASALAELTERFNQTLEHSLSPQSIGWRIEAMRTQRPFAEIVLLHSLVYRVEQVFLVHRESGLLLQHVVAQSIVARDPDMVSGMLTAIRDFVTDSFELAEGDSLAQVQYGELTLRIAQGPNAILAAVVRGTPPASVRGTLQETLEQVHSELAREMKSFDGEVEAFEPAIPLLEECLVEKRRERAPRRAPWVFVVLVVLVGSFFVARALVHRNQTQRTWERAREQLAAAPGLLVLEDGRRDGRRFVRGLRDPHAVDPAGILRAAGLDPESIDLDLEPYTCMDAEFVLARAERALAPPPGVTLELSDGVLRIEGAARHGWLERARHVAAALPGLDGLDSSAVEDLDLAELERASALLESFQITFASGTHAPEASEAFAAGLSAALADLERSAAITSTRLRIEVTAGAAVVETDGEELARRRADSTAEWLAGLAAGDLAVRPDRSGPRPAGARATLRVVRWNAAESR